MFSKIVIGVDGSTGSHHAAVAAIEFAQKFDAELLVVSVLPPVNASVASAPTMPYAMGMEMMANMEPVLEAAEHERSEAISEADNVFDKAGVRYRNFSESGNVAEAIVRVADEQKADLIVVGSRGLTGFERFLFGSTSDSVTHNSHCPVLIIR